MDTLVMTRQLWDHAVWADHLLLAALTESDPPAEAWREYSHVLGAESVWLDRLLHRPARIPIWPTLTPAEATALSHTLAEEYAEYIAGLSLTTLDAPVAYINSAGQSFSTPVSDILLQVVLHGQYHRGKINLLLRQASRAPIPTDYISFVRGVPAARTDVHER